MVVGGGGGVKSFSCQTQLRLCYVELMLSWGFDNIVNIEFSVVVVCSCSVIFVSNPTLGYVRLS